MPADVTFPPNPSLTYPTAVLLSALASVGHDAAHPKLATASDGGKANRPSRLPKHWMVGWTRVCPKARLLKNAYVIGERISSAPPFPAT